MSLKEKDIIRRAENWKKYREAKEKINAEAKRESIKRYWGNIYRVARNAYLDSILIAEKGDDVCIHGCYCHTIVSMDMKYKGQQGYKIQAICKVSPGDKCPYPCRIESIYNHNPDYSMSIKNNQILSQIEKKGNKA